MIEGTSNSRGELIELNLLFEKSIDCSPQIAAYFDLFGLFEKSIDCSPQIAIYIDLFGLFE
jgi:hypothetical protein